MTTGKFERFSIPFNLYIVVRFIDLLFSFCESRLTFYVIRYSVTKGTRMVDLFKILGTRKTRNGHVPRYIYDLLYFKILVNNAMVKYSVEL